MLMMEEKASTYIVQYVNDGGKGKHAVENLNDGGKGKYRIIVITSFAVGSCCWHATYSCYNLRKLGM